MQGRDRGRASRCLVFADIVAAWWVECGGVVGTSKTFNIEMRLGVIAVAVSGLVPWHVPGSTEPGA